MEAQVLLATVYLDAENLEQTKEALERADRLNRRLELPQYAAAIAGLRGRVALAEGDEEAAATAFTAQAGYLREAGALATMVVALRQTADVYRDLGMEASAGEFYYRAANSLLAQGQAREAKAVLGQAQAAAEAAGDPLLLRRIRQLLDASP